ncbi:MAG: metallophosphoesterase family protein [Caulobacteraceae bacterium]
MALNDIGGLDRMQDELPLEIRPRSTNGEIVYAIGDIHGRYDLLKALLALISEDQAKAPLAIRKRIIFCGDYVDRGPASSWVVEALKWIRASSRFDVCMLMGNHEQSLLRFIEGSSDPRDWLAYGGAETLMSYGVQPPVAGNAADCDRARAELLQAMPASHLDFLAGLQLKVTVGDYAFVHAGIRPGVPLDAQETSDLLWIRGPFIDAEGPFEKVIVHGHTWISDRPQQLPHRIGIDTGAYETGVLTAVRLHGDDVSFLRAEGSLGVAAA